MKKNFKFIILAAAATAMIGCAKENGEDSTTPTGTETVASFRISFPPGTRVNDTATPSESTIKDAWVFLFDDATKTLESKTPLTNSGSAYSATVRTTTGKHYIYVAVNGASIYDFNTAAFPQANAATNTPGMAMTTFLKLLIDAENSLPVTTNNFFMTGYEEATFIAPTIQTPNPAANNLNIGVGRAVGKVHMNDAHNEDPLLIADNNPENVVVKNLKYKAANNPVTAFGFQQYDMETKTGTIRNHITGDGSADRSLYYRTGATYAEASAAPSAGVYVPENWNEEATTHNATSLLIQGRIFINAGVKMYKADGSLDNGYTPGATFYRVWDKTAEKWLGYIENGVRYYYFFSEIPNDINIIKGAAGVSASTEAAFSGKKITQEDPAKREFFIATYTGGESYWMLPLKDGEKTAVKRNDYFWVTIRTIADIGASTDSEDPDEDGPLPPKPEPVDEFNVDIDAEITILKWNGIDQNGHI